MIAKPKRASIRRAKSSPVSRSASASLIKSPVSNTRSALQFVDQAHGLFQHFAFGESTDVHIAHLRNRHSVQCVRKIDNRQNETPDADLIQLIHRDSGQTEGENRRQHRGAETQKVAATPTACFGRLLDFGRRVVREISFCPSKIGISATPISVSKPSPMKCQMKIAETANFGTTRSQSPRDILAAMTAINPIIIAAMKIETTMRATP